MIMMRMSHLDRAQGGRVEDAARGARQPLVRRRRRLRGRRVDVRLRPRGDGHRAGAQAREAQVETVRTETAEKILIMRIGQSKSMPDFAASFVLDAASSSFCFFSRTFALCASCSANLARSRFVALTVM